MPAVLNSTIYMVRAAKELGIPLIVSTHYPKAFGGTITELQQVIEECYGSDFGRIEKTQFSIYTPEFRDMMTLERPDVIFTGIEAHICVQQSCFDLVNEGYRGRKYFRRIIGVDRCF